MIDQNESVKHNVSAHSNSTDQIVRMQHSDYAVMKMIADATKPSTFPM